MTGRRPQGKTLFPQSRALSPASGPAVRKCC